MKGFFTNKEVTPTKKVRGVSIDPCEDCKLYKSAKSPKMGYTGKGKQRVLIVGEAPGSEEDEQWERKGYKEPTQFIGKSGLLLRDELDKYKLSLEQDFWKTNALCCRPPKNRKPTKKELSLCKHRLIKTIEELRPKMIWLVGGTAIESFYMNRFKTLTINRWQGLCIPDKATNAWIAPMFHPSYILRLKDPGLSAMFTRSIKNAVSWMSKGHPTFEDYESQVECVTDFHRAIELLTIVLREATEIAFDYETSGLKPYKAGHKIWSVAICSDVTTCFSIPLDYPHWSQSEIDEIDELWQDILLCEDIDKIAHNLKFEEMWTRQIYGVKTKSWYWCTMNAAHLIDDRAKYSGLKFQAYINYGVEGYDKATDKYKKSKEGENFNTFDKAPLQDLLLYNGLDALLTYKLFQDQEDKFRENPGLTKANDLWMDGLLALTDAQDHGIPMNKEYYDQQEIDLDKQIKVLFTEIMNSEEAKEFKRVTGHEINLRSSKDLKQLLFEILGFEPMKLTDSDNPSVDKDTLAEIDSPFTKKLTEMRILDKIKGTYLAQFIREIEDDKMHPFFDLHTTRTMRSSSSMPNFQNIPVRNELAKKCIRSGIIPSPGNRLCEVDYGSIEVRVAACFTQDPVLIKYINDPKSCMHRDQAKKIFNMTTEQVMQKVDGTSTNLRFYAKNQFVFPEFYGSWYKACASKIWENCMDFSLDGDKVKDIVGMTYPQFESHLKKVEDDFWNRFKVFKRWQETSIANYIKNGYVEMFFGHRRGGYLSHNKIINTPIQGTAFHLLLWSLIRINNIRKSEGWKTKIIGQIHDSILFDLYPPETKHVLTTVKRVMCEDIRKENTWIVVPLDVDFEITPINGSWYEKEGI